MELSKKKLDSLFRGSYTSVIDNEAGIIRRHNEQLEVVYIEPTMLKLKSNNPDYKGFPDFVSIIAINPVSEKYKQQTLTIIRKLIEDNGICYGNGS